MDAFLDTAGVWLAKAYMAYGILFLLMPLLTFGHLVMLGLVGYAAWARAGGRRAWPWLPLGLRRAARVGVEMVYGFVNPLIYLAVLTSSMPGLVPRDGWSRALVAVGWVCFVVIWGVRLLGRSIGRPFDEDAPGVRRAVRLLLMASLACLALFAIKDLMLGIATVTGVQLQLSALGMLLTMLLRTAPLYLIPALLLIDYLRATDTVATATVRSRDDARDLWPAFFLMPTRVARVAIGGAIGVALLTAGFAAHRRSDAAVQRLVVQHRDAIQRSPAHYDVDPRLVAAIVYVTHRDELSPFRGALERLAMSAWAHDRTSDILLDRPLDLSVGLAQIKPRTAQTAGLLAHGLSRDRLPQPQWFQYRGTDEIGSTWPVPLPASRRDRLVPPFPVPSDKQPVVQALLQDDRNLDTCALILALYQAQWEEANPAWSLRARPDILATLYQIGFARSRPHAAPRSNDFGRRVQEVHGQAWLTPLFDTPAPSPPPAPPAPGVPDTHSARVLSRDASALTPALR